MVLSLVFGLVADCPIWFFFGGGGDIFNILKSSSL